MMTCRYLVTGLVSLLFIVQAINSTSTTAPTPTGCTIPPHINDATFNYTGRVEGSTVTYNCSAGFRATGSMQKVCQGGRWRASGNEPACTALYCSRPPSVLRGSYRSLSGYSYRVGVVVTYNCYTGYVLKGTADIRCLSNRTWTGPLPTCEKKDCGPAVNITGGNVTYTDTVYLSYATYTCREGYDLYSNGYLQRSGRSIVRCLSTGLWALPPLCRPKDCRLPSNIRNGLRFSSGQHNYQDTVTYECISGYFLRGNATITCLKTGRWTILPTCEKVQCEAPPKVDNALTTINGKAYYGNSTTYRCVKGHEMFGPDLASCQADGTWTQVPICTVVDCRTPPTIHYGKRTYNSTKYRAMANYVCDAGYTAIGVSTIHCNAQGAWSPAPSCELPPGKSSGPSAASKSKQVASSSVGTTSALTGLAIACALFAVITLLCLLLIIYKFFIAGRPGQLFSYASYKNGDDTINSNM